MRENKTATNIKDDILLLQLALAFTYDTVVKKKHSGPMYPSSTTRCTNSYQFNLGKNPKNHTTHTRGSFSSILRELCESDFRDERRVEIKEPLAKRSEKKLAVDILHRTNGLHSHYFCSSAEFRIRLVGRKSTKKIRWPGSAANEGAGPGQTSSLLTNLNFSILT